VSGLENKAAIAPPVHALQPGTWLSCVTPEPSQEPHGAYTIDQLAATHIGQDTPLPSLEVATEGRGGNGACDRTYGCSYGATISFRSRRRRRCRWNRIRASCSSVSSGRATLPQERKAITRQFRAFSIS
jgi:hypothetical protein